MDDVADSWEVNFANSTTTWLNSDGGDNVDFISVKGHPTLGNFSFVTKVQLTTVEGKPLFSKRIPGEKMVGGPWSGRTEAVDDPITGGMTTMKSIASHGLKEGFKRLYLRKAGEAYTNRVIEDASKRKLPRNTHGDPTPDSEYPHTQIGEKKGRKDTYRQTREWNYGKDGKIEPKRDVDWTDHGRPKDHTNPHEHVYKENSTGGTPERGGNQPVSPANSSSEY